jgi:hypothetical protein
MTLCGYQPVSFAGEIAGVEWTGAKARQAIALAFADLPTGDDRLPDLTVRVGACSDPALLTVFERRRCLYRGTSVGACAHLLLQTALDRLITRSAGGIVVHSGLVGHGDAGVLLPGATGSGKTMLCAWLTLRGLAYFSDEACFVAAGTSQSDGFARPLCFRGRWAEPLGLPASVDAGHQWRSDDVSLVPSGQLQVLRGGGSIRPRLIVFPHFEPGAPLAMTRLSPARAAVRLLEAVANCRNLPDHGVGQVTNLARTVPAYHLVYGAFDQLEPLWTLVESTQ